MIHLFESKNPNGQRIVPTTSNCEKCGSSLKKQKLTNQVGQNGCYPERVSFAWGSKITNYQLFFHESSQRFAVKAIFCKFCEYISVPTMDKTYNFGKKKKNFVKSFVCKTLLLVTRSR